MMKNSLLWQRWVALTIPLDITNSVINTWQLLCVCRDVWVCVAAQGGGHGDNRSVVRMQQPLLSPLPPPMGGTVPECQWEWQGKAWLCLSWEQQQEWSWLMGKMLISGAVATSSAARGVHLWLGRLIPAPSCHSSSLQLCSPLFSLGLYSFRPQPNNSVSGAGLSARAPTRHSLKQWHRADQIMEGGTALLSQQHFSSKD